MSTRPSDAAPDFQVLARGCESRTVLDHVTGRWGTLILLVLHGDAKRFSELRRSVDGINEKALAQSLRQLERDGFVDRAASEGYPSRVEYRLTETGRRITARLTALVDDLYAAMPQVLAAQAAYDSRRPGGPVS
ncbi:helix-turn-helix transcriptional regulator [Glycomyces sp. A-F 0318]|uniref:winged helix-turn-helix transcriptional regulator n=1 Tax=Glycomyces amatae TaxID=2881355 RepID=UPI001E39EC30|nr:helix-turn-helix domain-containing protein [Glycomyces amatae]MCD0444035.1 helix-turn-helix transcriptional regulator [Glycomyces amatae]